MRRESDAPKGFTIIETMLFLALTGLMIIGVMVGIGSNLARTRYRDSVEDIASLLRNQYDQVNRVQIQQRNDTGICDVVTSTKPETSASTVKKGGTFSLASFDLTVANNTGRGRSNCDVYGVAVVFGLGHDGTDGRVVQVNNLIGKDILYLEDQINDLHKNDSLPPDAKELIAAMSDQELLKNLSINNVIERNSRCEVVNSLDRKVLNWNAIVEDTASNVVKKAIVLIIRSPRDGTVHTYSYDFSDSSTIGVVDYTDLGNENCHNALAGSIDINDAFNQKDSSGRDAEMLFNNTRDLNICIASNDVFDTYGKRRMITIKADGHNSSAVVLQDLEGSQNLCQ